MTVVKYLCCICWWILCLVFWNWYTESQTLSKSVCLYQKPLLSHLLRSFQPSIQRCWNVMDPHSWAGLFWLCTAPWSPQLREQLLLGRHCLCWMSGSLNVIIWGTVVFSVPNLCPGSIIFNFFCQPCHSSSDGRWMGCSGCFWAPQCFYWQFHPFVGHNLCWVKLIKAHPVQSSRWSLNTQALKCCWFSGFSLWPDL